MSWVANKMFFKICLVLLFALVSSSCAINTEVIRSTATIRNWNPAEVGDFFNDLELTISANNTLITSASETVAFVEINKQENRVEEMNKARAFIIQLDIRPRKSGYGLALGATLYYGDSVANPTLIKVGDHDGSGACDILNTIEPKRGSKLMTLDTEVEMRWTCLQYVFGIPSLDPAGVFRLEVDGLEYGGKRKVLIFDFEPKSEASISR